MSVAFPEHFNQSEATNNIATVLCLRTSWGFYGINWASSDKELEYYSFPIAVDGLSGKKLRDVLWRLLAIGRPDINGEHRVTEYIIPELGKLAVVEHLNTGGPEQFIQTAESEFEMQLQLGMVQPYHEDYARIDNAIFDLSATDEQALRIIEIPHI